MLPQLLLLLVLLGPGGSLPLEDPWRNGTNMAPGSIPTRAQRQVNLDEEDEDYFPEGTDSPETLSHHSSEQTDTESLPTMSTPGQRNSTGIQTPEPATVDAATRGSAAPPAGHSAGGTQGGPVSVDLTTELTVAVISTTTAPSTDKILSTVPTSTEKETTQPAATETQTVKLGAIEAETTQPAATEAKATQSVAMEAKATQPAATEGLTMKPMTTEAVSTEAPSTEPAATPAPSTEPASTKPQSTVAVVLEEKGAVPQSTLETASNLPGMDQKAEQVVPAGSSVTPRPTGASERIPVRQCLLAILILALVATIFLVCTVVLAVRLSRRNHMYPVRNYSPTEMVCISSLLPDTGDGGLTVANGGLPKSQPLKAEHLGDRDGDDLTLHSFLP